MGSEKDAAYGRAGGITNTPVKPLADGKRHGRGVRVWSDGSRYEGDWFQDVQHGFGVYVGSGQFGARYEGEWKDGLRHGAGVESYGNTLGLGHTCPLGFVHHGGARCFYDGQWERGRYHGEGTLTCGDGRQYHGQWSVGKRHGYGRLVMVPKKLQYTAVRGVDGAIVLQGTVEEGEFGMPVRLDDSLRVKVWEGEMRKNKRWGLGRVTLNCGDVFEGWFERGRPSGVIRIQFASGKTSFAMFKDNRRQGWITGSELRTLEESWHEETRAEREQQAKDARAVALLAKLGAFKFGDNNKLSEKQEAIKRLLETAKNEEDEEEEKRHAAIQANSGVQKGVFNAFSSSTLARI